MKLRSSLDGVGSGNRKTVDLSVVSRRRFLAGLAGLGASVPLSALLAACGGEDDDPTSTPAAGSDAEKPTPDSSPTHSEPTSTSPQSTPESTAISTETDSGTAESTSTQAADPGTPYVYPEYDDDLPIFTIVSESDETLLMQDARGEVEIPRNPERVFVMDELALDIMLGIGMQPVGVVGSPDGTLSSAFDDRVDGIEIVAGWEPDLEAVLALSPDLIVSMFGWTNDMRDMLEEIAPTLISHPGAFPFWRQATLDLAAVLGMPDEGARLLDDYDAAVQAARADLPGALRDGTESIAVVQIQLDEIRVYGVGFDRDGQFYPTNVTQVIYSDLRLTPSAFVQDLSQLDPGGGFRDVSLELLPQVDSEHLVLIEFDPDTAAAIESNPVFEQIPAVQLGNVYRLSDDASALGPVNMIERLETFIEVLSGS